MQVKRTKRILRSRERRRANSSFLNSWERPSALATAVATPNLSRSCMSRYSRSTRLFFHRTGAVRAQFTGAALLPCPLKPIGQEVADVHGRRLTKDQIGHDLGRNRRKEDAIAKVACRDKNMRDIGLAEDGQIVRRAGAQSCPALGNRSRCERRNIFCSGVLEIANYGWIYRFIKAKVFHGCAD